MSYGSYDELLERDHLNIDEMVEYYKENEATLARELRWMGIVLRRADIVSLEEKQKIE